MISVYLTPKDKVHEALKQKGCEQLESPIDGHTAWRSPWGQAFLVPHDNEDRTADWKLDEILRAIDESKPSCS